MAALGRGAGAGSSDHTRRPEDGRPRYRVIAATSPRGLDRWDYREILSARRLYIKLILLQTTDGYFSLHAKAISSSLFTHAYIEPHTRTHTNVYIYIHVYVQYIQ